MLRKLSENKERQNAQGMVEFALILPILLLVILGIIEFGRLLFFYSSVTSASREAARYGSAVGEVNGVDRYRDCAGIRDAARRVGAFAGVVDGDITIQYDDGTNLIDAVCPPSVTIDLADRIVITVSKNFTPLVPLVNIPPLPITSTTARTIIKEVGVRGTPVPTDPLPGVNTPTPTDTPEIPNTATNTATATATDTATATATDTGTPLPTGTATVGPSPVPPTATYTPIPPTPTNTVVAGCAASISGWDDPQADKITWDLNNIGGANLNPQSLTITVNNTSAKIDSIYYGANEIFNGNKKTPWTVSLVGYNLPPGGIELTFYFSEAVSTDYMHLSVSVAECNDPVSDDHN